jgi:hypothetical protein
MTLILPPGMRSSRNSKLRDALGEHNAHTFATEMAMADALSMAAQKVARQHKLKGPDILRSVLTSLVSIVQSGIPESEWDEVGQILADEIRARLTVTGIT